MVDLSPAPVEGFGHLGRPLSHLAAEVINGLAHVCNEVTWKKKGSEKNILQNNQETKKESARKFKKTNKEMAGNIFFRATI